MQGSTQKYPFEILFKHMSNTTELNDKLVSELRLLAKSFGIPDADSLRKPDLIAKITEQQNLIEAARLQQQTVTNNYTEHNPVAAAAEESADKPRKRTRTLKSKIEPHLAAVLISFGLTYGISSLSYEFYESKFLNMKKYFEPGRSKEKFRAKGALG